MREKKEGISKKTVRVEKGGGVESVEKYTPKKIGDLVYWTFLISQGSSTAQEALSKVLCRQSKSLEEALQVYALTYEKPESERFHFPAIRKSTLVDGLDFDKKYNDDRFDSDPFFLKTLQRVSNYFNGESHVPVAGPVNRRATVVREYDNFLRAAHGERIRSNDEVLNQFVWELVTREVRLHGYYKSPHGTFSKEKTATREKQGRNMSLFFKYGFSEKRHEAKPALPEEIQHAIESAAQYVMHSYSAIDDSIRNGLNILRDDFEAETGERIEFPEIKT